MGKQTEQKGTDHGTIFHRELSEMASAGMKREDDGPFQMHSKNQSNLPHFQSTVDLACTLFQAFPGTLKTIRHEGMGYR